MKKVSSTKAHFVINIILIILCTSIALIAQTLGKSYVALFFTVVAIVLTLFQPQIDKAFGND